MPWNLFSQAVCLLYKSSLRVECSTAAKMVFYGNLFYIERISHYIDRPLSNLMTMVLELIRTFQCSKLRDRYFALLTFHRWREESTTNIEGRKSYWQSLDVKGYFTDNTYTSIEWPIAGPGAVNNLAMICSAGTRNRESYPTWPSWVPDFNYECSTNRPVLPYGFLASPFNASGRPGAYLTIFRLTTPLRYLFRLHLLLFVQCHLL